jgi:predicted GNAT family acetyltransferase
MASNDLSDREEMLDETIEESFPASDAPANTVVTGVKPGHAAKQPAVRDNAHARRFEIALDGQLAFLQYEQSRDALVLMHTEVPPSLRGHGLASVLAKFALDAAHAQALRVIVRCPFVQAYLRKHPEDRTGNDALDSSVRHP